MSRGQTKTFIVASLAMGGTCSDTGIQQGVMVWDIISFNNRTHLEVISGIVTAQIYNDDILQAVKVTVLFATP